MLDLSSITKGFRPPEGGAITNKPSTSSGLRVTLPGSPAGAGPAAGGAAVSSPSGERSPTKSVGGAPKQRDTSASSASLREM